MFGSLFLLTLQRKQILLNLTNKDRVIYSVKPVAFIGLCESLYLSLVNYIDFMEHTNNIFLRREKHYITECSIGGRQCRDEWLNKKTNN